MKTYAMVLIMKKHRKQSELFLQYGYKLNCSKMKSPSICTKFKKSERVTKDVQNPEIQMKMTWYQNALPVTKYSHKKWKRAKFEYIKKLHQ